VIIYETAAITKTHHQRGKTVDSLSWVPKGRIRPSRPKAMCGLQIEEPRHQKEVDGNHPHTVVFPYHCLLRRKDLARRSTVRRFLPRARRARDRPSSGSTTPGSEEVRILLFRSASETTSSLLESAASYMRCPALFGRMYFHMEMTLTFLPTEFVAVRSTRL
jgi:hypothetical protein